MIQEKIDRLQINSDLKTRLLEFSLQPNLNYWIKNSYGPNRRWCNLNNVNLPLSKDVKEFAEFCFKEIFDVKVIEETSFGNFLGVNGPGAFVHSHVDRLGPNGEWHVRLNFLLQKPIEGGMPLIDSRELSIKENHCWVNFASKYTHSSTPVKGNISRVVLSLGSFIEQNHIKFLLSSN